MNYGLKRNYAAATMDPGHWGVSGLDGRWAYNNRVAENDFGWRAVTETARVAKALVKTYYGAEQKKAYFAGCSTGGRMANMEARKFPNDFDGIISGAPALDPTGLASATRVPAISNPPPFNAARVTAPTASLRRKSTCSRSGTQARATARARSSTPAEFRLARSRSGRYG